MDNQNTGIIYAENMQDEKSLVSYATEIRALTRQTVSSILRIGELLIDAKNRVPHGRWGEWLETEVSYSQATAARFMQVTQRFRGRKEVIGELEVSKVYALLMAPEESVEELAEAAKDMSVREFSAEVGRVREEYEARVHGIQAEFDIVREQKEDADGIIAEQRSQMNAMQARIAEQEQLLAASKEQEAKAVQAAERAKKAIEKAKAEAEKAKANPIEKEVPPADYTKAKAEAQRMAEEAEKAKAETAMLQQKIDALKKRMELPAAPAGVRAISVEDFAGMVSAMCTGAAALPYMGKRFKAMPEAMRSPYRAPLEQLQVFVTAAMAAIDGVELEVQDA